MFLSLTLGSKSGCLGIGWFLPLLFLAVRVEYRGKDSRGWCKGHKEVGHWEMKAVCDLLVDFFED